MPPKRTGVKTTANNNTPPDFIVSGKNDAAPFTLKVYRGEGMALLAMNWKDGKEPPRDFAGFAFEQSAATLQEGSHWGQGGRLHHKFVVIDFDKPTGRNDG